MELKALHIALLMEADRHGSVHPVTKADKDATAELLAGKYVDENGDITQRGRAAARQGGR